VHLILIAERQKGLIDRSPNSRHRGVAEHKGKKPAAAGEDKEEEEKEKRKRKKKKKKKKKEDESGG